MDHIKYMRLIGRKGGKRKVKKGFACPRVQAKAQAARRKMAASKEDMESREENFSSGAAIRISNSQVDAPSEARNGE